MDVISSATPEGDQGRRIGDERREEGERDGDELGRRQNGKRREGYLARKLVEIFKKYRLHFAANTVKLLKALKLFEPLLMLISAVISAVTYRLTMTLSLAIGFVVSLAVHEFGHFVATKYCGHVPKWWLHVPLFGASMEPPDFRGRDDEAMVAYGGPLLGALYSVLLFGLWIVLPLSKEWSNVLYTTAVISTVINLFNMIPLLPLDGGRITQAIHPAFRWIGFTSLFAASLYYGEASVLVVWILVVGELRMDARKRFRFARALLFAMPVVVLLGYHSKELWQDVVYFCFGVLILKRYHTLYVKPVVVDEKNEWRNQELPRELRLAWARRYVSLLLGLGLLLAIEWWYARAFVH